LTHIKAKAPQTGAKTSTITRFATLTGEPSPAEAAYGNNAKKLQNMIGEKHGHKDRRQERR
jgi:hypothetical protein